ncbi:MAG TPA: MFS transporter [Acidimicrobiia bacterium]
MSVRNFRLYFVGQFVSATGTWMQAIAQMWLVLRLTESGVALGVTTALQFAPMLVAGAWGGVVADRVDKRRLLVATQVAGGALALLLGLITALGVVELWMIYGLAFLLGCVTALDNPARRAFVIEMVGAEHVTNAVSLSSALFTAARIFGPALAGIVIAVAGVSWCFIANAVSYAAAVGAFAMMRRDEFFGVRPVPRAKGQLRAGLRYAWSTPSLRLPLVMTAVIGTLAFNSQVVLALLASDTFAGDAGTYGLLYALLSVGAVTGALVTAHQAAATRRFLLLAAAVYGGFLLMAAAAPTLPVELVILVPTGAAGVAFVAMANGVLQTHTDPLMRGRVMALFSVAFLGSTPIGGPILGWVSEAWGPRAGLALGGIAALATAAAATRAGARRALRRPGGADASEPPTARAAWHPRGSRAAMVSTGPGAGHGETGPDAGGALRRAARRRPRRGRARLRRDLARAPPGAAPLLARPRPGDRRGRRRRDLAGRDARPRPVPG